MIILYLYIIGWFIFTLITITSQWKINSNKKLLIYHSAIEGLWSWLGIIFYLTAYVVDFIFTIAEKIEKKLS